MQAVILAGGLGSRLSEETVLRPKPLIEIAGKPILWHLMKNLSNFGISDFIILAGYKAFLIKEYFLNYKQNNSNIAINVGTGEISYLNNHQDNWNVTVIDTGEHTQTGSRLLQVSKLLKSDPFLFTYGDGLANIDLIALKNCHSQNKSIATVTAVRPQGRFGHLVLGGDTINNKVVNFKEKEDNSDTWINAGFFILQKDIFSYIEDEFSTSFEYSTLPKLAKSNQLSAYKHDGFWHAMDTMRDKMVLEDLWNKGLAPWHTWQ